MAIADSGSAGSCASAVSSAFTVVPCYGQQSHPSVRPSTQEWHNQLHTRACVCFRRVTSTQCCSAACQYARPSPARHSTPRPRPELPWRTSACTEMRVGRCEAKGHVRFNREVGGGDRSEPTRTVWQLEARAANGLCSIQHADRQTDLVTIMRVRGAVVPAQPQPSEVRPIVDAPRIGAWHEVGRVHHARPQHTVALVVVVGSSSSIWQPLRGSTSARWLRCWLMPSLSLLVGQHAQEVACRDHPMPAVPLQRAHIQEVRRLLPAFIYTDAQLYICCDARLATPPKEE
jgi:hypothetical protein